MKIFSGKVIRVSPKTAKVAVDRLVAHPIYGKRMKRTKNYLVQDELNVAVGDKVRFAASRPMSKTKKWKIIEVVDVKKEGKNG